MIQFILNDTYIEYEGSDGEVLADFVRRNRHLKGTKIGCREGDCGACTVLIGLLKEDTVTYRSMTSCLMPMVNVHGNHVLTVEGINMKQLSPVQSAVVDTNGTQCGFCTVGFIMSLTEFVLSGIYDREQAIRAIDGNICRCTGYKSIERAIDKLIADLRQQTSGSKLGHLVTLGFLPQYLTDIEERLRLLHRGLETIKLPANPVGKIVGGGTDLFVQIPSELRMTKLASLVQDQNSMVVQEDDNVITLSAASTVTDLQQSQAMKRVFPNLNAYFKLISSTPIRNMATLGGNLVNASPIGDMTVFFLALDSLVILRSGSQRREVKLKDFYLGYKDLDLQEGEILESVYFKKPKTQSHFNFEKVSKRTHLDIASVNTACFASLDNNSVVQDFHLSAGGVAPIPKYLKKSSMFLRGKTLSEESITQVLEMIDAEISPISDVRGSARYKKRLLKQLVLAHFEKFGVQAEAIHKIACS